MNIRLLEPDVLFAFLPAEPQLQPELALLRKHLSTSEPLHLILDCAKVEIITSVSIGGLLLLRQRQVEGGTRLILCAVSLATRCVFRVAGLESVLCYAADKSEALQMLRPCREPPAEVSIAAC